MCQFYRQEVALVKPFSSPLRQEASGHVSRSLSYVADTFPALAAAPIVPTRSNLVATRGFGHAFKLAPVPGDLIAFDRARRHNARTSFAGAPKRYRATRLRAISKTLDPFLFEPHTAEVL